MAQSDRSYKILEFKAMGDERGQLVALESMNQVPFDIKRVFYVYGTSGDKAHGCHANKKTKFVIISVSGSCIVTVNNGVHSKDIILDCQTKGLYLDKMVWKEMHSFSKNSVLMVLCSEKYDQEEYVHNFDEYLDLVAG
ncbi:FdtA/QdtA family cupin domain-containing protein [Vibrio cholerae]